MKNYFVVSLGCSKNLVDAENMLGLLNKNGYRVTDEPEDAEIIIINTCAFIDPAKQESIDTILEYAVYKETGKCRSLIVTGCLAERYKDEVLKELPEVDAVLGTSDYGDIVNIVSRLRSENHIIQVNPEGIDSIDFHDRVITTPFYTAYLKIAEGCDNCCTYCVIPQIRGKYKSRPIEDLIEEATMLAENGAEELIVVAQDTTYYGTDLYGKPMLGTLLEKLSKIEDLHWIRLHYTYPELITDNLIDTIAKTPKVLHYLDIPVQHSEDKILKKMGRKSRRQQLLNLFETLRKKIPDIILRTSMIVGFPGETEEDFLNLCEFIKQVKFDRLGVFAYSQEEGTPAAKMEQVEDEIKQKRQDQLMQVQMEIALALNQAKIGTTLEVLVEGYDTVTDMHIGRTYGDSIEIDQNIFFSSDYRYESGDFVNVLVTSCEEYRLFGEAVEAE